MSCDHQLLTENLFDYLEGTLAPELEARCEQVIKECPHCAATCQQARMLRKMGDAWQDHAVPEWHRTRYAVKPPVRESHWSNWAALAASFTAVLLVVFQLEVSTANGLTISFGGQQSEQRLEQALAAAIADYRQEQDILLTARLADFAEDQEVANQLLLSEWADESRQERRSDLDFIMSAWESQRFQDQRQINRRFDTLASSQIESDQFVNDLARNVNFRQRGITP